MFTTFEESVCWTGSVRQADPPDVLLAALAVDGADPLGLLRRRPRHRGAGGEGGDEAAEALLAEVREVGEHRVGLDA